MFITLYDAFTNPTSLFVFCAQCQSVTDADVFFFLICFIGRLLNSVLKDYFLVSFIFEMFLVKVSVLVKEIRLISGDNSINYLKLIKVKKKNGLAQYPG